MPEVQDHCEAVECNACTVLGGPGLCPGLYEQVADPDV